MVNPIYVPKGKAKEYGELALNIFTGCPHGCEYCYAPLVLKKDRKQFHNSCTPRKDIVYATATQLKKMQSQGIKNKEIFLSFTCDPFPMNYIDDLGTTYTIVQLIKEYEQNIAILTKGNANLNLLKAYGFNENDRFGVTISCSHEQAKIIEPKALDVNNRLLLLKQAKDLFNCKTFISCEPVYDVDYIKQLIRTINFCDEFRIGKLNYVKNTTDWKQFGIDCEALCKEFKRGYYIKESLRNEMLK